MGAFLVSITAACLLYSCTEHIKEQCDKSCERIGEEEEKQRSNSLTKTKKPDRV
ncbi:hypothetical protein HMPREF1141_3390 [Clostridium sp. MSTE9]|nr:hypothetical protein HMPREF1141_3390 [Clostridium sp. MSTE9]